MKLPCTCTFKMFHRGPQIMALPKYFKRIKPSKEEIKNSKSFT